jgi:hypothetical protein
MEESVASWGWIDEKPLNGLHEMEQVGDLSGFRKWMFAKVWPGKLLIFSLLLVLNDLNPASVQRQTEST